MLPATAIFAHFPRRRFRGWLLGRAVLFWIGGRLLLLAVMQGGLPLGLASVLIVVAVTAVLMVEARQRGELLLLANVGVSPVVAAALSAIPPLLGEAALNIATVLILGGVE